MTERRRAPGAGWIAVALLAAAGCMLQACTPSTRSKSETLAAQETGQSGVIAFGVMGDVPYSRSDERHVPEVLMDMHRAGAHFALHVGDLKGSFEPCTESLLAHRIGLLAAGPLPVIFTPGDNEWTDCHRLSAGRFDPLDRLKLLRKLTWPALTAESRPGPNVAPPPATRHALPTEHQSGLPENARWRLQGLHFITLHVVGSRNGQGQFPGSDTEMASRMSANARWLDEGINQALREHAQGLVIAFHADPDFGTPPGRGYQGFQALLQSAAERFKGPILLIHGDGHRFRVDRPLPAPQGHWAHVTRLEAFGWPRSRHWALVIFDAEQRPAFRIIARAVD